MSLSEQTMLDLMAYADGELDASKAKRIEKLVARDEEASKVLEAMQTLTECVQISAADVPPPRVDVDGIVDSVMKTVSTLPIPKDEERPLRLIRGAAAGIASALIAVAASFMLFAPDFSPTPEKLHAAEVLNQALEAQKNHQPPVPAVEPVAPVVVAAADPPPVPTEPGGVELDHVESPSHEVSIFYVPALAENLTEDGDNASTSVVVWIGDNQRGL